MTVEVANESGIAADEVALVSLSRYVLDHLGVSPTAELSLLMVDVPTMTELHVKWLGEPGPTDVMSFPMDELDSARSRDDAAAGPALLGDVVLCPDVAAEQAASAGHGLDDELQLLTTHGILHLLGYDHVDPVEERAMFRLQNELLDSWRDEQQTLARRRQKEAADTALLDTAGLTTPGRAGTSQDPASDSGTASGPVPD